jgi:hypothetical protein
MPNGQSAMGSISFTFALRLRLAECFRDMLPAMSAIRIANQHYGRLGVHASFRVCI